MSRKIYVTASEMRTMREEGMSNRDIANALDISYQTVVRYIGKQGGRMDSLEAFRDTPPKKATVKEEPVVIPKYEPKPVLEKYHVNDFIVELDSKDRYVMISGDPGDIVFHYDSIPDLVQFLAWAMRERMEVTADADAEEVRE
jgi:transposase